MRFAAWRNISHHDLSINYGMYATDIPYVFSTSIIYIWTSLMLNSNEAGTCGDKRSEYIIIIPAWLILWLLGDVNY
jgi:hypothetical protein